MLQISVLLVNPYTFALQARISKKSSRFLVSLINIHSLKTQTVFEELSSAFHGTCSSIAGKTCKWYFYCHRSYLSRQMLLGIEKNIVNIAVARAAVRFDFLLKS